MSGQPLKKPCELVYSRQHTHLLLPRYRSSALQVAAGLSGSSQASAIVARCSGLSTFAFAPPSAVLTDLVRAEQQPATETSELQTFFEFHLFYAMADQYQQTKESAGHKMDQTAQYGQEKTGQAHDQVKGMGQAMGDKAHQAGDMGRERMEQAKQGTTDAAHTTGQKATEAKDKAGGMLQQAGDKTRETVGGAMDKVKETFSSDNK